MKLTMPEKLLSALLSNGNELEAQMLKDLVTFHEERYIKKHKPLPERPPRLLGQNGLHYLQMCLFRSRALVDGYFVSFESDNPILSALTTRAHFEVTGGVAYFLKKLKNFYSGAITYEQIDESLGRLNLGMRAKSNLEGVEVERIPDPVNVMSFIQAADHEFKKISSKGIMYFQESYDDLSEFCHPNSLGMFMGSTINKIAVVRYNKEFAQTEHPNDFFFNFFAITSFAFMHFYDEAFELLEKNEDFPIILG